MFQIWIVLVGNSVLIVDQNKRYVSVTFTNPSQLDSWDNSRKYDYVIGDGDLEDDEINIDGMLLKADGLCVSYVTGGLLRNTAKITGNVRIECDFEGLFKANLSNSVQGKYELVENGRKERNQLLLVFRNAEKRFKTDYTHGRLKIGFHANKRNSSFCICVIVDYRLYVMYGTDGMLVHFEKIHNIELDNDRDNDYEDMADYGFGTFKFESASYLTDWIHLDGRLI